MFSKHVFNPGGWPVPHVISYSSISYFRGTAMHGIGLRRSKWLSGGSATGELKEFDASKLWLCLLPGACYACQVWKLQPRFLWCRDVNIVCFNLSVIQATLKYCTIQKWLKSTLTWSDWSAFTLHSHKQDFQSYTVVEAIKAQKPLLEVSVSRGRCHGVAPWYLKQFM